MKTPLQTILLMAFLLVLGASSARAAEQCGSLFAAAPGYVQALDRALEKTAKKNKVKGLSERDLSLIVESVFKKSDGRKHKFSEYWKNSATERTQTILAREAAEHLVHQGLIEYFKQHGLLKDKSRLYTKFSILNRSRIFNGLSLFLTASSFSNGRIPMFIPEGKFNIKSQDLNTLLLEGISSPSGKEIMKRYKLRLEANRGYEIFNRYYSRMAIVVWAFVAFQKADEFIKENRKSEGENAFDILMTGFEDLLLDHSAMQTKEDILFETVVQNFEQKFQRAPTGEENLMICKKVYGPEVCL